MKTDGIIGQSSGAVSRTGRTRDLRNPRQRIESESIDQTLAFLAPHRTNGHRTKPYCTTSQCTKPYGTKYCTKPYCTKSYRTKHYTKPYCTKSYFRKPSSNHASIARDQVPSACYRKGKRRKDIDLTTSL